MSDNVSKPMFGSVIRLNPFGVVVLLGLVFFFIYMYMDSRPQFHLEPVSMKKLLAVGIEVAETGGKEVRLVRLQDSDLKEQSKGKTKEGANVPLTDGDLRSHRVMVQGFLSIFPNLKVVSEEKDETLLPKGSWLPAGNTAALDLVLAEDVKLPLADVTVWIDPLDATQEYTENLLEYVTTMVCIAVQGKPIIGIIHQPFTNRTVWAWVGHGISPNVRLPSQAPTATSIVHSRSHEGDLKILVNKAFGKEELKLISAGGAGYKVLQVLEGSVSAYIHVTNIMKWDICAGNAILKAADGEMTTISGQPISYSPQDDIVNKDGLLATLFHHQEILKKLRRPA